MLIAILWFVASQLKQDQRRVAHMQQRLAQQQQAWQLIDAWQSAAATTEVNQRQWFQGQLALLEYWQQQRRLTTDFDQQGLHQLYLAQLTLIASKGELGMAQLASMVLEQQPTPVRPQRSGKTSKGMTRKQQQQLSSLELMMEDLALQLTLLQQRVDLQTQQLAQQKMQLLAVKSAQLSPASEPLSADLVGLFVDTLPANAKVEVLNIRDRYTQGISLPEGKYLLRVSAPGFDTINRWVQLLPKHNRYCVSLADDLSLKRPGPSEHQSTIFKAPCTW
ncbi:hypothetical protein [uncultured Ferrimonas sp.]|uniref:hypothetical protein n=1 Tax=uncultured Ferrimonas sp. TaxID=432640 RepID=UPI00261B81AE|nr:hypothetical protein [uncultured Ferrimonas sp.]